MEKYAKCLKSIGMLQSGQRAFFEGRAYKFVKWECSYREDADGGLIPNKEWAVLINESGKEHRISGKFLNYFELPEVEKPYIKEK